MSCSKFARILANRIDKQWFVHGLKQVFLYQLRTCIHKHDQVFCHGESFHLDGLKKLIVLENLEPVLALMTSGTNEHDIFPAQSD